MGGRVGTGSLRRRVQLLHGRPDLDVVPLRGNVDTRLRKMAEMGLDALILAAAGLNRLGLTHLYRGCLSQEEMLPAVGQGAVAIETHVQNELAIQAAAQLQHEQTRIACLAERALLRSLGGGCQLPIAGHAIVEGQLIRIEGLVASPDGARIVRDMISGPAESAAQLGAALGQKLRDDGADSILQESLS